MRFLVAGLVLIALGVVVTEYGRRHQDAPLASSVKKKKAAPVTPPTTKALIETVSAEADVPGDSAAFASAVTGLTSTAQSEGFSTLMTGVFTIRALTSGEHLAAAVVSTGAHTGLVGFSSGAPPVALAAGTR